MKKKSYAVIMAGGIGSRFWPLSRAHHPKQFLDLLGTGRSLLQETYARFATIVPEENIFVVANQLYQGLVLQQLPSLPEDRLLLEPVMRNTAPCIAYAVAKIADREPGARIVVSPSDHLIVREELFKQDVLRALEASSKHKVIITLGIEPTRPDTGYGYIQYMEEDELMPRLHKVKTFTEKPNQEVAQSFLASGDFLWNSGLFIFTAETMRKAIAQLMPDLAELFAGYPKKANLAKEHAFLADVFPKCKNISIDFGVMEKAENVYVIPSTFGWSDLGNWDSLYSQQAKDAHGNAVQGQVALYGPAQGNLILGPADKLVVVCGVKDLIVVDMEDVLLICPRNREQYVKEIVGDIKKTRGETYT